MRAIVFGGPDWLAQRTLRACERARIDAMHVGDLRDAPDDPAWLLRAGAWFDRAPRVPPPSATGRPLVALGALPSEPWRTALARSGGDLQRLKSFPPIASAWVEKMDIVRGGLESAIAERRASLRIVRLPELDVQHDDVLRVAQITTTLQQGGAERIVLDLVHGLRARSIETRLILVGRPQRKTFPAPADTIDLGHLHGKREQIDRVAEAIAGFGPDVVHAHLLAGPFLEALAVRGIRCVVTVHNARPGWPAGYETLDAPLVIACANAVNADLPRGNVRTIRNAIDPAAVKGASLRSSLGIPADAIVLAAVANPRPQKRLHLLPAVARAVAARTGRDVRVVLAGAPMDIDGVTLLGSLEDVGSAYRTADVLVSTSAWEGLSLAQLEALACGTPVVATDVGGTREIPGVNTVPVDASPEAFAEAIAGCLGTKTALPSAFRTPAMIDRHAMLYRRALATRPGRGVVLVANNFSTGGAQSSARRLLSALHRAGVPVRAHVVQEHPKHATPGRTALEAAGIPVGCDPESILADIDRDPPKAVLFWNLLAKQKLRLADALVGVRVIDVSPGEMYFADLERHFGHPSPLPYDRPRDYGALLDAVVVKYAGEAERAREVLGAPVHVVPNGIDPGPAPPLRRGSIRSLVTVCRIAPQKKLEDLFAALRLVRSPWELRVVGAAETGSERYAESLRASTRDLPVAWIGERQDVRAELDHADAFVMISEPAGCPNASLEAMAAGLPIVATDVGGAREQVIDGETGFLAARGDPEAFARAIGRLDPEMGLRGRAHVERAFSLENMVASYRALCGVF